MNRNRIHLLASVTAPLLLALLALSPVIVSARQSLQPRAVELLRFELRSVSAGVEIEWETATESDIAYFKIQRGPAPDGPYADLAGIGLVEAMGSTVSGYTYTVVDDTAAGGESYSYQLVELTLSNDENVVAEDVITVPVPTTPEIIGGLPPTNTPTPTRSAQTGSVTPQPTTDATAGSATPRPTATLNGSLTTTPSTTVTDTTTTPTTPTRAANTLGPTPTRFSFTPRPATAVTTTSQTGAPVVEAAEPPALAQVTGEPYPAPGGAAPTPQITDVLTTQVGAPEQAPGAYPGNTFNAPGDLPTPIGAGAPGAGSPGAQMEDQAVEETSGTTRLLLWLGFLAAFFIFIGGIGFSIVLSTRRRENDLP